MKNLNFVIIYTPLLHSTFIRLSFITNEDIFTETWEISISPLNFYSPQTLTLSKVQKKIELSSSITLYDEEI